MSVSYQLESIRDGGIENFGDWYLTRSASVNGCNGLEAKRAT